jgi:hypothetical protein
LNPNAEISTADFADFTEVKRVLFMALASDFAPSFISKLWFIRALCASCGFNSGFRVLSVKARSHTPFFTINWICACAE